MPALRQSDTETARVEIAHPSDAVRTGPGSAPAAIGVSYEDYPAPAPGGPVLLLLRDPKGPPGRLPRARGRTRHAVAGWCPSRPARRAFPRRIDEWAPEGDSRRAHPGAGCSAQAIS